MKHENDKKTYQRGHPSDLTAGFVVSVAPGSLASSSSSAEAEFRNQTNIRYKIYGHRSFLNKYVLPLKSVVGRPQSRSVLPSKVAPC